MRHRSLLRTAVEHGRPETQRQTLQHILAPPALNAHFLLRHPLPSYVNSAPYAFSAFSFSFASPLALLRSSFFSLFTLRSSSLSSSLGTGGLASIGSPNGAMMLRTTWCTCLLTRQPGEMEMMSPVRREERGSWTSRWARRLKSWRERVSSANLNPRGLDRDTLWKGREEGR